jgi:hypothetical protein
MKVVAMYVTRHGGLVLIMQHESGYDAYWMPDSFSSPMRLGSGSPASSLEAAEAYARDWDPTLTPIHDLGEFTLYCKTNGHPRYPTVDTREHRRLYPQSVAAGNVPVGTVLTPEAAAFFRFWLGETAVDITGNHPTLVGLRPS